MGDHKVVERAKLPPEVLAATGSMKDGQTSELIQIGQSFCVLRLNAHTAAGSRASRQ